jgi:hypothetical protein
MGYSSGGSCALQLTMRNPHMYTTAAGLLPDYKVKDDPTTGNLFGSGLGRVNRVNGHDLIWRLKHLPAPQVSVLVADSKHGKTWVREMSATLKWMNQQLTFPQDVVPRHHPKPGHTAVRASGAEPSTKHR